MKKTTCNKAILVTAAILAAVSSFPLSADEEVAADSTSTQAVASSSSSSMMDNMKLMQAQMAKIHSAKDPKIRTELLNEHKPCKPR